MRRAGKVSGVGVGVPPPRIRTNFCRPASSLAPILSAGLPRPRAALMLSPHDSLPVSLEPTPADLMQGIFQVRGLLKYRDKALVLEYKPVTMGDFGLAAKSKKSEIETRSILLRDVRNLALKNLGTRLIVEANNLSAFQDLPGSNGDRLALRIGWKDRKAAQVFVSFLRAELTEIKLGES